MNHLCILLNQLLILCVISTLITVTSASEALILTPLINQGQIQEARNSSKVDPRLFLNVTSYSGYVTVDEKHNSNTFFWYFPVEKKLNETPWIIWLQGGPGGSSLIGLFDEIGPFYYNDNKLNLREWTWTRNYSVVFIDNPVGAGFSFTNDESGFVRDLETCSEHLIKALDQLVKVYPELQTAPLYLAGESYAGRYIPAFADKINQLKKKNDSYPINLKGMIMGNPVINRESISNYSAIFYQWGLIDPQGMLAVKPLQDKYSQAIKEGNTDKALEIYSAILDKLQDIPFQQTLYNILLDEYKNLHGFELFLTEDEVKEALHVGNIKFTFSNQTTHSILNHDFLNKNMDAKVQLLMEDYDVLIYCGQLDTVSACVPNAEARRKQWHWSGRKEFLEGPRLPWWFNETVVGYVKKGGRFTEALIRGAGHLAPLEKPAQVYNLVSYFIQGIDVDLPPNYKPSDVPEYKEYKEDSNVQHSSLKDGLIASTVFNIILVLVIIGGVVFYLKKKKREDFFYSSVNSIPDEIFLS